MHAAIARGTDGGRAAGRQELSRARGSNRRRGAHKGLMPRRSDRDQLSPARFVKSAVQKNLFAKGIDAEIHVGEQALQEVGLAAAGRRGAGDEVEKLAV